MQKFLVLDRKQLLFQSYWIRSVWYRCENISNEYSLIHFYEQELILEIILSTFPLHTNCRIHLLDVSVYGPFEARFKSEQKNWLVSNHRETISSYNIAEVANKSFVESLSPKSSGFVNSEYFHLTEIIFRWNVCLTDQILL